MFIIQDEIKHKSSKIIPIDQPAVLFDIPDHNNFGDSLIWYYNKRFFKSQLKYHLTNNTNNKKGSSRNKLEIHGDLQRIRSSSSGSRTKYPTRRSKQQQRNDGRRHEQST